MPQSLQQTHQEIRRWYRVHGRKTLPWRITADPYAIWLSEVMLQQTQVSTVLERYYFPFLERFPTVDALAKADLQDILKAWEGLGYYRRARNLHAAAKLWAASPPEDVESLLNLPGIGRNTAHAVASFAFRLPVPVMEANVKRVLCRVFALKNPSEKELWEKAEQLLDKGNPFDHNQAMMDIGSLVCVRTKPNCTACPLDNICKGKANPAVYPAAVKKKKTPVRHAAILACYDNQERYLVQRREGEFLHGLWGFVEEPKGKGDSIGHIRQVYSHFTLEAEVFRLPDRRQKGVWKTLGEIEKLPLSKADQKVLTLLKRLEP